MAKRSQNRDAQKPRHATAARYDNAKKRIVTELDNGAYFSFPPALAQGLATASAKQLAAIVLPPLGTGLHWPLLDGNLTVDGLLIGVFGSKNWMRHHAAKAGSASTPNKAGAAPPHPPRLMLNKLPARWYLSALSSNITVLRDQGADAMNAVVIEHVPLAELPKAWRDKLHLAASAQVRVRIEEENVQQTPFETSDPAFGIWRAREDMQDVNAYVRKLREPRYGRDGARSLP